MVYGLFLYAVVAVSPNSEVHKEWKLLAEFRSENAVEAYDLCKEASYPLVMASKVNKPGLVRKNDFACVRMSGIESKDKVYKHENGQIMRPNPSDGSCWTSWEFGCSEKKENKQK